MLIAFYELLLNQRATKQNANKINMNKLKLYIETSVWNFLFADDAPDKKKHTELLFKEIESHRYDIYISDVVLEEIHDASDEKRALLLDRIQKYQPAVFTRDLEVDSLAESYIEKGVLKRKHFLDVLHLAIASANGMNILISWNMRHIVRRKTQLLVSITNRIQGYQELEIWTPEELMDHED